MEYVMEYVLGYVTYRITQLLVKNSSPLTEFCENRAKENQ